MRGSSFKQIKLSRSLENKENCTYGFFFTRLSEIKLHQLFTGKESIVLKSLPTVVVFYFTAIEKDNLRTESYSYKEQTVIVSQCTGRQNYVMKNEKNSDYYYLSNRKMILSKLAGLLFPRKFNKRTSLFTLMRCNSNLIL